MSEMVDGVRWPSFIREIQGYTNPRIALKEFKMTMKLLAPVCLALAVVALGQFVRAEDISKIGGDPAAAITFDQLAEQWLEATRYSLKPSSARLSK